MPMLSAAFVQEDRILRELDLLAKDHLLSCKTHAAA